MSISMKIKYPHLGQSNNLWVEFKSGHSGVSQGFQLTVLSVQGEDNSLGFLKTQIDENYHLYNFRGAWIPRGSNNQHWGHCHF